MSAHDRARSVRRRRVIKHAGAGITAVTLAGCQTSDGNGGDALSGETVKLGLLPPDKASELGAPMINCMELAV